MKCTEFLNFKDYLNVLILYWRSLMYEVFFNKEGWISRRFSLRFGISVVYYRSMRLQIFLRCTDNTIHLSL